MSIKTAKITQVNNVSEPYGQHGTLYHNLTLDNGDKINIGKKSVQKEGWEITYTIEGDPNQQEFVQAKAAKKPDAPSPSHNGGSADKQFRQDPDKAKSIEMQVCLKEANQYHAIHGFTDTEQKLSEICDTARFFYENFFLGKS